MILRLIQNCWEFVSRKSIWDVGPGRRGIYVLYQRRGQIKRGSRKSGRRYDVLYVGMTDFSIRSRLYSHARSKRKKAWTHFSAFTVWPNVTESEIRELEGLFRHIYRYDGRANVLNLQKGYKAMRKLCAKNGSDWGEKTDWAAAIQAKSSN